MRANLTFFFSKIAPIFSTTAPPKDQNGSVVFYFGPSPELKLPYTRRAESPLRGHRLIGAVLTPKKDRFCGQRFGPNFGVVSTLLNLHEANNCFSIFTQVILNLFIYLSVICTKRQQKSRFCKLVFTVIFTCR